MSDIGAFSGQFVGVLGKEERYALALGKIIDTEISRFAKLLPPGMCFRDRLDEVPIATALTPPARLAG